MESIRKLPGQIMGLEILRFENAEIEKFNGSDVLFSGIGPLSVLYFPTYDRFVLQINDWKYPLLRRLPVTAGLKNEAGLKSFTFPGLNDTTFNLRILDETNLGALSNLEEILKGYSKFSYKGEQGTLRKAEASPDDRLVRHLKEKTEVKAKSGIAGTIAGAFKSASNAIKGTSTSLIGGGKKKAPKMVRSDLKSLKTKDFKKTAKATFKKDFFPSSHKSSDEFLNKRRNNAFSSIGKSMSEILKANEKSVPALYFFKEDIEESILANKDVASSPAYNTILEKPESRGIVDSLKQGLQGLTTGISQRLPFGQERGRASEQTSHKLVENEGMAHLG